MTAPEILTVVALWSAAAYRANLARTKPAAWRTALALGVCALAIATTSHFNRARLDEWLGLPNATNLGSRLALCVAVASAQLYLLETRRPDATVARRRAIYAGAAVTGLASVIAWIAAPIHRVELPDLADAPRLPASLVYAVTIYLYLAWFQIDIARYAHRSFRGARDSDPPAAAAIALIGASAWAGCAVLLTWTAHSTSTQVLDRPTPLLDRVATVLFPIPLTLFAIGLLALPVTPAISHRLAARRLTLRLNPLWQAILNQHPHVHLRLRQDRVRQTLDPRLGAQRRLIEISDGLEEHHVESPSTMHELARAIASPPVPGGPLTAKDALAQLNGSPWPEPLLSLSDALEATRQQRGEADAAQLG